jgi:hypothetical protein
MESTFVKNELLKPLHSNSKMIIGKFLEGFPTLASNAFTQSKVAKGWADSGLMPFDITTILRKWPGFHDRNFGDDRVIALVNKLPELVKMASQGYLHREAILAVVHDALPEELSEQLLAMKEVDDKHVSRWSAVVLNFQGVIDRRSEVEESNKARALLQAAERERKQKERKEKAAKAVADKQRQEKVREERAAERERKQKEREEKAAKAAAERERKQKERKEKAAKAVADKQRQEEEKAAKAVAEKQRQEEEKVAAEKQRQEEAKKAAANELQFNGETAQSQAAGVKRKAAEIPAEKGKKARKVAKPSKKRSREESA